MAEEENGAAEAAAETTAAPSLEETMGAVFDKMQAPDPASEPPAATPSASEGQSEASASPDERPRGPDGKFIKAEKPAESAAPKAVETPDQPKPIEQAAAPSTAPVAPPVSWSADAKIAWATLPPAVQQAVLKREDEVSSGFRQKSDQLKQYEPIGAALEPLRQTLAMQGVEPATYVRSLIAADQALRTQPQQAIQWIARQYGIDLNQAVSQPAEAGQPTDPTIAALQTKISSFEQYLKQQDEQSRLREQQAITGQIETFRSALNADGSPKHPHFEDVRAEMAALMQAGRAESLDQAYEMASWANPAVRAKILADQKAKEDAARAEEAAKKAAEARRVAGTNLSARGAVSGSPVKPRTIEESLAAAYDRAVSAA
jgi:hypothetical protein